MWILTTCVFDSASENSETDFIFQKNDFENFEKLKSIIIFFPFL